jgi:hypothetical protein
MRNRRLAHANDTDFVRLNEMNPAVVSKNPRKKRCSHPARRAPTGYDDITNILN